MEEREIFIKSENIRTMKKDIARLKGGGKQEFPAVSFGSLKKKEIKKPVKKRERKAEVLYAASSDSIRPLPSSRPEPAILEKKQIPKPEILKSESLSSKPESRPETRLESKPIPDPIIKKPVESLTERQTIRPPDNLPVEGSEPFQKIEKKPLPVKEPIKKEEPIKEELIKESLIKKDFAVRPKKDKKLLLKQKENLNREKSEIDKKLKEITVEKRPFDDKRNSLFKKIEEIERGSDSITGREKKIEKQIQLVEKREAIAETGGVKRRIEQKRWKLEEKRQELEKQRWPWDEKLKIVKNKLEEIETECIGLKIKEDSFKKEQAQFFKKGQRINLELERVGLEENLDELGGIRKDLEEKKTKVNERLGHFNERLEDILLKEKGVEQNKQSIEEREEAATDFKEKRGLEKQRWEVEEKRRKIESERWDLESEKGKVENEYKRTELNFNNILEKETNLEIRIKEIDRVLSEQEDVAEIKPVDIKSFDKVKIEQPVKSNYQENQAVEKPEIKPRAERKEPAASLPPEPEAKPEPAPKPVPVQPSGKEEAKEDTRIEQAKKRIEALKDQRASVESAPVIEKEEKKVLDPEFKKPVDDFAVERKAIKRKEALIKEEKRRQELSARFEGVKPTKKGKKTIGLVRSAKRIKSAVSKPETLPKKPSLREKLWIRILVFSLVLILLAITATFWYWYLVIRKQPPPSQEPENQPEQVEQPPVPISAFPSSFLVDEKIMLEISSSGDLSPLFAQTVQENQDLGKFKQIIVKDTQENRNLNLKEILTVLGVNLSEDFYQKTGSQFTLFINSQINGSRIGFILEISQPEGFNELLSSLEGNIKNDLNSILNLMGGGGPALISYFRNASQVRGYNGINFRYQTLNQEDLGICYLIYNNYFIFTSSWKSMTSVINKLGL